MAHLARTVVCASGSHGDFGMGGACGVDRAMNHTPGPWHRHDLIIHAQYQAADESVHHHFVAEVADIATFSRKVDGSAEANAMLIAAAPDLLEQLKTARGLVEKWCHTQGNSDALFAEFLGPIDAALRKATDQ